MNQKEIQKQCIEWCEKRTLDSEGFREIDKIKKKDLENIAEPKFKVHDIVKVKTKKYNIFFIRDMGIFETNGIFEKSEWRYFGSYFNLKKDKIVYQTTSSYIPEKCLTKLI